MSARTRLTWLGVFAVGLTVGFALALTLVEPSWKRNREAARHWRDQYTPVPWNMTVPEEYDTLDSVGVALDSLRVAKQRTT